MTTTSNAIKNDAVIVLANQMDENGLLNFESKARANKAVEIFNECAICHIITCGWAYRNDSDIKIADAMKSYIIDSLGINPSKVITELNLDQTGEVEVSTINGTINSKRFGCGLLLENHSKSINIQPAEFSHRKECDVIIGMDIIQYGLFILDKSKFSFTIEQLK